MTQSDTPEATRWTGRNLQKDALREQVWSMLEAAAAVPGDPRGTIPDFAGADAAAARLSTLEPWLRARVIKCTPDACQAPIRLRALQQGRVLYRADPRLAVYPCFLRLTATELEAAGASLEAAATMEGAITYGVPTPFEAMEHVDLVCVGSVAATSRGGRTGKGAGFADLELALLREFAVVDEHTTVITTVHELSIVDDEALPIEPTDSPLDWVITADRAIETHTRMDAPQRIDWSRIRADQLRDIPILATLAAERGITG